ncbi:cob(I)yrinic acid a,c-diamide adenosyltransferase [Aliamphritea ceti]|uniref:cob(I)yrinic acid a,c-diamide adenosyltransferase n=1 Tax=Aliamphritea ceti TaxID=1524258 RepID=UPI0021C330DF|nr:cob(I)yrinic acid a,c-diamide adenosyltransferase [Aliamphritea ceti]
MVARRLTKIYTRTGDKGTTALANGSRVDKHHPRIETMGDVDELNCLLGVLVEELASDDPIREFLTLSQHCLFDIGGEIAVADAGYKVIAAEDITQLEQQLDQLNEDLPPLQEFILPGGNRAAALCHQARSVCRRAERRLVELVQLENTPAEGEQEAVEMVNNYAAAYVNRLSDLLFVSARVLARRNDGNEVLWQPKQKRTAGED